MPKRADTLETVTLALEILRRIPRNSLITASTLHAQLREAGFQRDLRSIQRLLEMLSSRFDIECDNRSKPYGYRWKENSRGLAVPLLSEQDSLLLMLAKQHMQPLLPVSLSKSMESFFTQAGMNLGPHQKNGPAREWLTKVRVVSTSQPLLPPKLASGVFEAVSHALYNNRLLELSYKNAGGKRSQPRVMPLGLAQQGSNLYLVCRYEGFNNERSLALHRIQKATMSTMSFERPKDFDLEKYDADGRFGFGNGQRVKLSFRIDRDAGAHLYETPLAKDQIVRVMKDGRLEISATVVDAEVLTWWLRGFGDKVSHVKKAPLR